MIINQNLNSMLNAPVRKITAKVELYNGSTLLHTFNYDDKLVKITVERIAESSKFFGFGIVQHAKFEILDTNREIDVTTDNHFKIYYGANGDFVGPHPSFYVTQARRDENTNVVTIYGYDVLHTTSSESFNALGIAAPYTIKDVAESIAEHIGAGGIIQLRNELNANAFEAVFTNGANFNGDELLRDVLDDVAEATQTIYYVDNQERVVFKRLDKDVAADLAITKDLYFTMDNSGGKRLSGVASITELGDNVEAKLDITGTTQYIKDNAFMDIQENVDELVTNALAAVGGLTINQFTCSWRGNFLLELGDKLALTTKDGSTVYSFVLDDVITYDGKLSQETQWSYDAEQEETATNSVTLGDVLKQTTAKVDKVNKEITLVVDDVAKLELTTEGINTTVKKTEENIGDLIAEVNTKVSAEDVTFIISTINSENVDKVTTATGYTFNEDGLRVSKTDSEISTIISEDGMQVLRKDEEVLVANNQGVKAEDLHATTFLVIGKNSRFEDYNNNRTGCFWIGGV
jgi:hypothetical protein